MACYGYTWIYTIEISWATGFFLQVKGRPHTTQSSKWFHCHCEASWLFSCQMNQTDCSMCWETRQNIPKHVCKRNLQRQRQTNAAQHIVSNPFSSLLHRQIVWISKGCSSCHFLPGFIRLARDWPLTCSNSLGIGQNIRICYWWLLIHWWLLIKMQVAPKSIVAGDGTWRHYKKKTVSDRASLQTLQRFQISKHHVHWKRTCTSHTTWHYIHTASNCTDCIQNTLAIPRSTHTRNIINTCIELYCTVLQLYCMLTRCIVVYCIVLSCVGVCCIVWYSIVLWLQLQFIAIMIYFTALHAYGLVEILLKLHSQPNSAASQ